MISHLELRSSANQALPFPLCSCNRTSRFIYFDWMFIINTCKHGIPTETQSILAHIAEYASCVMRLLVLRPPLLLLYHLPDLQLASIVYLLAT